jgi:hypothetical protein
MRKGFFIGWIVVLLAGGLLGRLHEAVRAASAPATVRPAAEIEVGLGQTEALQIVLQDVQAGYGIDLRLRFDPAYLEVVDSDLARDGVQIVPGGFPKPDFIVRNQADNTAGLVEYVTTQVSPTLPINGAGVVLTLHLRGKALGESQVTVESILLADRRGQDIPAAGQAGRVIVIAPKALTPTAAAQAAGASIPAATPTPGAELAAQPAASGGSGQGAEKEARYAKQTARAERYARQTQTALEVSAQAGAPAVGSPQVGGPAENPSDLSQSPGQAGGQSGWLALLGGGFAAAALLLGLVGIWLWRSTPRKTPPLRQ